jgi:hypothetical protein
MGVTIRQIGAKTRNMMYNVWHQEVGIDEGKETGRAGELQCVGRL